MRLTGYAAIEFAEKHNLRLTKRGDRIDQTASDLSVAEASAIAEEDEDLIYLDLPEEEYHQAAPTSLCRSLILGTSHLERGVVMADQQNRGGKKQGPANPQGNTEQHQGTGPKPDRPPEGKPGGPKQHEGQTRPNHGGEKR